jgi:hypothetical protein
MFKIRGSSTFSQLSREAGHLTLISTLSEKFAVFSYIEILATTSDPPTAVLSSIIIYRRVQIGITKLYLHHSNLIEFILLCL